MQWPLRRKEMKELLAIMPNDYRLSEAVASFGHLLRGGIYSNSFGYDDVLALAPNARGENAFGYGAEFL